MISSCVVAVVLFLGKIAQLARFVWVNVVLKCQYDALRCIGVSVST